jgi:hypothetical protein
MCSWRISRLALASLTSTRSKQHLPCLSTNIFCRSEATQPELPTLRSKCCASLTPTQLHLAHAFIAITNSCSSIPSAMSTKSLKRLSVRAKRSISGLHAFCDVFDSACASPNYHQHHHANNSQSDKENETPDLGEFGLSPNHKTSMSADVFPGKESPSRRKKLMGSLLSIGSLRGLRSSPLKQGGNERAAEPTEPVEREVSLPMRIVEALLMYVCRVLVHSSVRLSRSEISNQRHSHSTSSVLLPISPCSVH